MSAATVLDALGDPTRRAILEHLPSGGLPVGVLAERLPISRPAESQQLRVLKDAGLVSETAAGTRRVYRVERSGLAAVRAYLDRFWADALDGFAALAEEESAADAVAEAQALLTPEPDDPRSIP